MSYGKARVLYIPGVVEYTDWNSTEVSDCTNNCLLYDDKPPDGKAVQEFWEIRSTALLILLPGSLWPEVVVFVTWVK